MTHVIAFIVGNIAYIAIPAVVLYFVLKKAIKKAIIELKDENIL